MQTPSNKVGLVLIIVVLFVAGSILFSKIEFTRPLAPLEQVELVITRNTDQISNETWLDAFNQTQLMQFSSPGPMIEGSTSNPDSLTAQLATDLFAEYLILKQKGLLSQEDETILTEKISQKITQEASLKNQYALEDITVINSNPETVEIYGERVAQITIEHFMQMDTFKNQKQTNEYLNSIANQHQNYVDQLLQVSTPDVVQEAHILLINSAYQTKIFFQTLAQADRDPAASLVIVSQYQARSTTEQGLYTLLAQYFKNNGILFETESTTRFWNLFE
jgi:hypothetical protein